MNTIAENPNWITRLANVRAGKLDWTIWLQTAICVIPAMATLDFGMPLLGGEYLVIMLFLFLGYHVIKRDRYRYMSLLVAAGPALSLMRGVFFYKSIFVFLMMGMVLWAYVAWKEVEFVAKDPIWLPLACLCLLYWALSVVLRGNFGANLRSIEFALSIAGVYLLTNRRSYLATALLGMGISVTAFAIAMMPYGVRLGEGELDNGENIGNPVLLGMPCALVVLLSLTDRGRYLLLETKATARLVFCLVIGQWLVLSGSRGSWLVSIICLLIVFAFSAPSRKTISVALLVGVFATMVMLTTDKGAQVTTVFNKTVDSNRSLANRTSGRSSMWEALPMVFAASPVWGWGPGNAGDADFEFTHRHLLFHSLYEQIIAETGLLGAVPMVIILFAILRRAIRHYRRYGELVPLVGIVGFMLIGVSVTAFDFVSGVYLGLALSSREMMPRFSATQMRATAVAVDEPLDRRLITTY